MIIQAKNFKNRADLENEVRNKFGLTTEIKDSVIKGTREELAKLQLSDRSMFFGIRCEITDTPTLPKVENKVARGKLHDFGIGEPKNKIK